MRLKGITDLLDLDIDEDESRDMQVNVKIFTSTLDKALKKKKIKADVFVGGSFAKKTMIKSNNYDIDIFVRFHKDGEISDLLEDVLRENKLKYIRVHGSRDYFQIKSNEKITLEIIPVLKIKSPKDAKNVTDLSYFHVNYVRRKADEKVAKEIKIAKQFLKASGVYGAESYIGGISGYGAECLIIYYKNFEKMAKAIVNSKNKILIDSEKKYKGKEMLLELNESKLESPIVLVDPTFKERNVLAALRQETFEILRESLQRMLNHPKKEMFEVKPNDLTALEKEAKKKNASLFKLRLVSNKQEGDIAGTKMKKFSDFLIGELEYYFDVVNKKYVYSGTKDSEFFMLLKPKLEIIKKGPPLSLIEHAKAFRKEHKSTFMKEGILYARIKGYKQPRDFFNFWVNKNRNKIKEMDIINIEII
jgi:tRNA nucleotidyltransferase (CCA-adding enzyme)